MADLLDTFSDEEEQQEVAARPEVPPAPPVPVAQAAPPEPERGQAQPERAIPQPQSDEAAGTAVTVGGGLAASTKTPEEVEMLELFGGLVRTPPPRSPPRDRGAKRSVPTPARRGGSVGSGDCSEQEQVLQAHSRIAKAAEASSSSAEEQDFSESDTSDSEVLAARAEQRSRKKSEQASKNHLYQVAAAPFLPSVQARSGLDVGREPSANIEAAARLDRLKAERERLAASAAPAASSAGSFGAPSGVVHTIPEQNCRIRVDNLKESREHFTDLAIQDREIRPEKLEQLMKGKKFVPLAKLGTFAATIVPRAAASGSGTCSNKEKNNATELENVVLIAVLQESFPLPKRSAGGGQYLHWTLTDVNSPAPTSLRLMLFDNALENWRSQESVKQGAIFAVLNARLLSSAASMGGTSKSHAVTVEQATQILKLGHFPHLGFCRGTKKATKERCNMALNLEKFPSGLCCFHGGGGKFGGMRGGSRTTVVGGGGTSAINPNFLPEHLRPASLRDPGSFRGIGKIFGDENAKAKANKSAAPAAAPGARTQAAPGGTRLAEAPLVPPGAARGAPGAARVAAGAAGVVAPGADAAAAFEARQRATKRGNAMKQDNSILKMAAKLEGTGAGKMNAGNINMMNSRMGGGGVTATGGTGGTGGTAGSAPAPKMSVHSRNPGFAPPARVHRADANAQPPARSAAPGGAAEAERAGSAMVSATTRSGTGTSTAASASSTNHLGHVVQEGTTSSTSVAASFRSQGAAPQHLQIATASSSSSQTSTATAHQHLKRGRAQHSFGLLEQQALEAQLNTDRLANILRSDDPRLLNYGPAAKRPKVVQAEPPPPKHRPGAFALRVQEKGADHLKALGASSGHTFHRSEALPQAAGAASTGAPSSSSTSSHLPLAADPNKSIASSRFLARYGSAVARDICNVDLKQVAVPQTKAAVEVEEQKANEVHCRLRQLEQQDAEHESKLEVRSLPVTAFFCRQCKLLTEKRPSSTCEAVGHTVEVMREVAKERLVCAKCKFSVYILNGRMPRRCGKCKGENCWRKVGFYAEKGSSSTTSGGAGGTSAVTRDLLGGEFHARNVEHQRAIDFEDRKGGGDAEGDGFGYRGL